MWCIRGRTVRRTIRRTVRESVHRMVLSSGRYLVRENHTCYKVLYCNDEHVVSWLKSHVSYMEVNDQLLDSESVSRRWTPIYSLPTNPTNGQARPVLPIHSAHNSLFLCSQQPDAALCRYIWRVSLCYSIPCIGRRHTWKSVSSAHITKWLKPFDFKPLTLSFSKYVGTNCFFLLLAVVDNVVVFS